METSVVCLRRHKGKVVQDCDVYIGRRCNQGGWKLAESKWHNPFSTKEAGSAEQAVTMFRKYISETPALLADIGELRGKRLGCWCKKTGTEACHGDVLAELADANNSRKRLADDEPPFRMYQPAFVSVHIVGQPEPVAPFTYTLPRKAIRSWRQEDDRIVFDLNYAPEDVEEPVMKLKHAADGHITMIFKARYAKLTPVETADDISVLVEQKDDDSSDY